MVAGYLGEGTFALVFERDGLAVKVTKRGNPNFDSAKRMLEHHDAYNDCLKRAGISTPYIDSDIYEQDGLYRLRVYQRLLQPAEQVSSVLQASEPGGCKRTIDAVIADLRKVHIYNAQHQTVRLGISGKPSSWFRDGEQLLYVDTFPPFFDAEGVVAEDILTDYASLPKLTQLILPALRKRYFTFEGQVRKLAAGAYNLSNGIADELVDHVIEIATPNSSILSTHVRDLDRTTFYDPDSFKFRLGKRVAEILFGNSEFLPNF